MKKRKHIIVFGVCLVICLGILEIYILKKYQTDHSSGQTAENHEKRYKIGLYYPEDIRVNLAENINILFDEADIEGIYPSELIISEDELLTEIERQIEAGADGIITVPPSDDVILQIVSLCEDAGVYFTLAMRVIEDETITKRVLDSPYFVGAIWDDPYEEGVALGEYLVAQGYRSFALVSTPLGVYTDDAREEGLKSVFSEANCEVVAKISGMTTENEVKYAVLQLTEAYPELDCIIDVGDYMGNAEDIMVQTLLEQQRKDIHVTGWMMLHEPEKTVDSGLVPAQMVVFGKGGTYSDYFFDLVKLINAVGGTPVKDTRGKCVFTSAGFYLPTEPQEIKDYSSIMYRDDFLYGDAAFYTNLLGWKRNGGVLTEEEFSTMFNTYDIYTYSPTFADRKRSTGE